jgi:chromosome segregation ATPase
MKWHISHRHEIPAAFDALGKDYKSEIANLNQEIVLKNEKAEQLEKELEETQIALMREKVEKTAANAKIAELEDTIQKMMMMIAIRDILIKDRLNIELPNPFK